MCKCLIRKLLSGIRITLGISLDTYSLRNGKTLSFELEAFGQNTATACKSKDVFTSIFKNIKTFNIRHTISYILSNITDR